MDQSLTIHFNYDVFLSFRGEDTRHGFAGNLYNALCKRGINTFFDENLRYGEEISPSLFGAIRESRMSVIILSENYATSTWCLDELAKILECMEQNNQLVWPIFYKVDPSDIRHQRNSYDRAMAKHEIRFGKNCEKVINWRSALTKVTSLKGFHFETGYEYDFVEKIVKKISSRLPPNGLYVGEHVVGLEPRLEKVISLLNISSHSTVQMLGIYGIGGIGKTTLVKALYNFIVHQFEYACFLFDVRETSKNKGLVSLQETFLSKIFEVEDIKLSNADEGAFQIKNRLRNKSVLLVLDNVDCEEQLEQLAGECNWFGPGSRIIMTTRDKHLLHPYRVEKTYEMVKLNVHEASELFCWKAFNSSQPPEKFVDLSNEVVNYASGLPLALVVIGSHLLGKDLEECECALKQYKRIPNSKITSILRISYDDLEENQKEIFLDIACFFKGYSLKDVIDTWDACDFGPKYHIGVLVDKSLITINNCGNIRMHDLIQDMGREVVRKDAPKEPERRSRLCSDEDVVKVLEENSGTSKIEGIMLKSSSPQKIKWNGTAFKKMKNLRILIIRNARFSKNLKYLPNNIRFIEWEGYPWSSLPPSFDPKKLIVWNMPHSCLKLEKPFKKFINLNMMDFSCCQFITEVPDMSGVSIIRKLNLSNCENLVKVHDSVGFLTKVTHLDLTNCKNLTSLPSAIQMTSLEELYIRGCTSLEHFPDILGNMDCLWDIDASDTAIKELPNSIGNLIGLEELTLQRTDLVRSIKRLSNLFFLDMTGCKKLREIYEIPSTLSRIWAENCTSLTSESANAIWFQAIKMESCINIIRMPGEKIPDWFDYRCKGRVLSFWARRKLPNGVFAVIHAFPSYLFFELHLFINGVEVDDHAYHLHGNKGCHVCLLNLNLFWGRLKGNLENFLVHEWNYVEIKVGDLKKISIPVHECGIYVFKQGTSMKDVQFEYPHFNRSPELALRNLFKRRATFYPENEPPKKLRRKHKPTDDRGKFHNTRTRKRTSYSVKKGAQILLQHPHNHMDFPWERLWKLHLPPKIIIFLWELCNCILPTSDLLNSAHVQVHQTCSLCGLETETSQHIFFQCTFTRALWFGSQLSIRPHNLEPSDVVHFIMSCLQMGQLDAEIHKQFTYPMALVLYTIWFFRNKAILRVKLPPLKLPLKYGLDSIRSMLLLALLLNKHILILLQAALIQADKSMYQITCIFLCKVIFKYICQFTSLRNLLAKLPTPKLSSLIIYLIRCLRAIFLCLVHPLSFRCYFKAFGVFLHTCLLVKL